MASLVFKNRLISNGSKYIIRLKKIDNNYIIPYTLLKNYSVTQTDNEEYVTLYNLLTDECEDLKLTDIDKYTTINCDSISENIKNEFTFINYCKNAYNIFKESKLPIELFYNNFMNTIAIDNDIQQVVIDFNFMIDEDIIKGKNIPDKDIENIKNSFYKLVNIKINENKNELNQLKEDCETEEDIEDIEQIIEMFDTCKEDICIENAKTIKDILDEWPPLLLPLPNSLDRLLNLTIPDYTKTTEIEQFTDLIKSIDADILFEFTKILDDFKETLDSTIYNDYKKVLDVEYYKKFDEKL